MSVDNPSFAPVDADKSRQPEFIAPAAFLNQTYDQSLQTLVGHPDFQGMLAFNTQEVKDWEEGSSGREAGLGTRFMDSMKLDRGVIGQVGNAFVGLALGKIGYRDGEIDRFQYGISQVGGFIPHDEFERRRDEIKRLNEIGLKRGDAGFIIPPREDSRPTDIKDLAAIVRTGWGGNAGMIRVLDGSYVMVDLPVYNPIIDSRAVEQRMIKDGYGKMTNSSLAEFGKLFKKIVRIAAYQEDEE